MDASETLKHTENCLRDLIAILLHKAYGDRWIDDCGMSDDKITKWRERAEEEERRLGFSDPRLFFYADFYDLKPVLTKNWDKGFVDVFGNKKKLEVFLEALESFRNPDAHRRELLPYQLELLRGIDGWIRTMVVQYYMREENASSYYARIDAISDNLGNVSWKPGLDDLQRTSAKLRPGDRIDITVSATDPQARSMKFHCILLVPGAKSYMTSDKGKFTLEITQDHIFHSVWLYVAVESHGDYHPKYLPGTGSIRVDDYKGFEFEILPPRHA